MRLTNKYHNQYKKTFEKILFCIGCESLIHIVVNQRSKDVKQQKT